MVSGDLSLVDHGVFNVSGADMATAVGGIGPLVRIISGAALHFIPVGEGQINLLQVVVAA